MDSSQEMHDTREFVFGEARPHNDNDKENDKYIVEWAEFIFRLYSFEILRKQDELFKIKQKILRNMLKKYYLNYEDL